MRAEGTGEGGALHGPIRGETVGGVGEREQEMGTLWKDRGPKQVSTTSDPRLRARPW